MKKHFLIVVLFSILLATSFSVQAAAGDYSVRGLMGPSFQIQDWQNQFKIGAEFDYDLGLDMGLSLLGLFGISNDFRFQLIPTFNYNFLYIGNVSFHGGLGVGYTTFGTNVGMDMRFSTGVKLPLGEYFMAYSEADAFVTPVGTAGAPITFDWLLGFGFIFK